MQHMLQSHSIIALSRLQLKLILNLSRFSVKTSRYDEMEEKKRKVIKSNVKKHEYLWIQSITNHTRGFEIRKRVLCRWQVVFHREDSPRHYSQIALKKKRISNTGKCFEGGRKNKFRIQVYVSKGKKKQDWYEYMLYLQIHCAVTDESRKIFLLAWARFIKN